MSLNQPHEYSTWPAPIKALGKDLEIRFEREGIQQFAERVTKNGPWDDWTQYQMTYEAEEAQLVHSFDEFQCLKHLTNLSPLPHQFETAKKVLNEMRGRAILADEVGLGKTIEAGLILKEYMIRGLVRKVLILVPASLILQWVRELNQKFDIPAFAQKKQYMWEQFDIVVASIETAKRTPHKDILKEIDYDLVIIDEAHKLKNKKTSNYQLVNQLRKKYCLLLTATPVQNDLKELFNLISILKPGQLGGQSDFDNEYVADKRTPKNEEKLREVISKVMIRNRRGEGNIEFTKRQVQNIFLSLSPEEQALYEGVTRLVKDSIQDGGLSSALALLTLQREVCSSRDAVFVTLVELFKKTEEDSPLRPRIWALIETIRQITANTKAEKAIEIIQQANDKVIIFTEYRASQEYLLNFLKQHNIQAVPYRGGMNRGKKDWMMDLFRNRAQVMVATEAGGEGINLQFCHRMINFDLPWNPMRVEQRIGRVHRLGQTKDVHIYNLSTKNTIEEHILLLLHEKINMFERVIGGLDQILERFEEQSPLEESLSQILLRAESNDQLKEQFEKLGSTFNDIRTKIEEGKRKSI